MVSARTIVTAILLLALTACSPPKTPDRTVLPPSDNPLVAPKDVPNILLIIM